MTAKQTARPGYEPKKTVHLGYELGTGEPVDIPFRHMVVTGLTQHAGKTTTLEALLTRAAVPSIAFTTKRGEIGFLKGTPHAPYFRERADWQYVEAILEASLRERLRFERSWIMRACKGATTLRQVHDQVRTLLKTAKGIHESVYTSLDHYLELVVPQVEATRWASTLELKAQLTVMDLTALTSEMQALVIRSTVEAVVEHLADVVVVLPEAWAFLPQSRGGPVKAAADRLLREGAVLGNYGWLDSQDLAGLDKRYLKHVGVWLLGCQPEANEADHTLRQIPLPRAAKPTPADIQALGRGEFYACWEGTVRKVYVQPAWLDPTTARAVAMGTEGKGTAYVSRKPAPGQPVRSIPRESHPEDPAMCQEHAKLAKQVVELEQSVDRLTKSVNDASARLGQRNEELTTVKRERAALAETIAASTRFVAAFTDLVGPPKAVAGVAVDQVVEKVLARIPAGAGAVLQVTPPEKLRRDFQEAEVERLLETVKGLKSLPRRILLLLESLEGERIGQKAIAERLGRATEGGSWIDLGKAIGELRDLGLVEVEPRQGPRARIREKISADLLTYRATEADCAAVYQHVLTRLAEGGE